MKKRILTGLAALFMVVSSAVPTMAFTANYSFTFYSTNGFVSSNSGYKNDMEQKYYLTIESDEISSNNVFGTRIRKSADNTIMSNYITHTSEKKSQPYSYTKSANKTTLYYMRGKKDDSSTSTSKLHVEGRVTY